MAKTRTRKLTAAEFQKRHGTKKTTRSRNTNGEAIIAQRLSAMGILPFEEWKRESRSEREFFVQQFKFHPDRKFRADFAIPFRYEIADGELTSVKSAVLLEYEGGTWNSKFGHSSGAGIDNDILRSNEIEILGFKLLRFTASLLRKPKYFEDTVLRLLANG